MNAAARVAQGNTTAVWHSSVILSCTGSMWQIWSRSNSVGWVSSLLNGKLCMTVYKCLHNQAPDYLSELYTPVAQVAERQHLRSASRRLLVVPRIQLDTYGRRALAVIGPTVWNALGNDLPDPDLSFGRLLRRVSEWVEFNAHPTQYRSFQIRICFSSTRRTEHIRGTVR